jgi:Peptidase M50B-like
VDVLARLWDRVSGSQPLPPAWVIGLTGLVALIVVLDTRSWRLAGKVITIAHESGHALVSVLSGRRLDGIRLHADSSGVTYSRGRRNGPGLVLTAAAGYVMPSLLGAGAAALLAARHLTAMLWLALVLLVATFLAVRNLFGAVAVLVTAGGVFAVSYYATAIVQAGFAYLAAWFLLFGGVRPVLELARGRRQRQRWARGSDADQLARLTGAPAGLWVTLFMLVSIAALVIGAVLLLPPGWHSGLPPGWHSGLSLVRCYFARFFNLVDGIRPAPLSSTDSNLLTTREGSHG